MSNTTTKSEAKFKVVDGHAIEHGSKFIPLRFGVEHNGKVIATAANPEYAELLVSAGDMLEALKAMLADVDRAEKIDDPCCVSSKASDMARAVIKKCPL